MIKRKLETPFVGMSPQVIDYITQLQVDICAWAERFEPKQRFIADYWQRKQGGGGLSCVLEHGDVFEKAGVNISAVSGQLTQKAEQAMFTQLLSKLNQDTVDLNHATFVATGISLVIHPRNPFVPTVHMNYRYFELEHSAGRVWWFGGGTDLTPYYLFEEDAVQFHETLKQACERTDPTFYQQFKQQCDDYFYLPHRKEWRGVGGIFFDYLHQKSSDDYFELMQDCSQAFIPAYGAIVDKRFRMPYNQAQRDWQAYRRGRYVEFNLLHDRGTLFGLKTNGRIDSIFMSLPPTVSWPYRFTLDKDMPEYYTQQVLQTTPRAWC